MQIIGLTAPAGSGKTTVASLLVNRHGFAEMSFAQPIRDFVCDLLDVGPAVLEAIKEHPHPVLCSRSPREFMQRLGTEFARDLFGSDLWIRVLELRVERIRRVNRVGGIVISDVRFGNEAEWVRRRGRLWHLTRGGRQVQAHISELGIPEIEGDMMLDNDCDLRTLAGRIAELLED